MDLKSAVAEVKLAYNISDYIEKSGITLRRSGSGIKGLCPFHNERTPSFVVNEHFQNYRCFGCGANGDLLKFVQEFENLEFFDALKKLAEDKGITLKLDYEEKSGVDFTSLRECMREVSNFFFHEFRKLEDSHPAKQEVAKRGFTGKSGILHGYAPENRKALYNHLKAKGFNDETILHTGACVKFDENSSPSDFWSGRLMFFITDITGKPIGWSGRKLYESDTRGKYVNSKDSVLFDKSSSLYNIFNAKKPAATIKKMYINEGQFDVEALADSGLMNAVAASGTAFTDKQAMIIRRLIGESGKFVFCFDGDTAGREAAKKVFTNVPLIHTQAYVVSLPDGMDPCDYRLKFGPEALVEFLDKEEIPLIEFVLNEFAKQFDLNNELEKTQYISEAARVLRTVQDSVLRETYIRRVSLDTFTSVKVITEAVSKSKPLSGQGVQIKENDGTLDIPIEKSTPVDDELSLIFADNEYGQLTSRLMTLVLMNPTLSLRLAEHSNLLPKRMTKLLEEVALLGGDGAVIVEGFTDEALASRLIEANTFPFSHITDSEEMFDYLIKRFTEYVKDVKIEKLRSKITQTLSESNNQGSEFLSLAIEKEVAALKKMEES